MCFVAVFGVAPVYFPMWGGLILGPKKGATEEEYYCESACCCVGCCMAPREDLYKAGL